MSKVKIIVHCPQENVEELLAAIGETGAGTIGEYSFCSFTHMGTGRCLPSDQASPHIGTAGQLEEIPENSIEVNCDRDIAKQVIEVIDRVHPYEVPAYEIIPLLELKDL